LKPKVKIDPRVNILNTKNGLAVSINQSLTKDTNHAKALSEKIISEKAMIKLFTDHVVFAETLRKFLQDLFSNIDKASTLFDIHVDKKDSI